MKNQCLFVVCVLAMFSSTMAAVSAQESTAGISGRVVDRMGAPIPGAIVTAKGSDQLRQLISKIDGTFVLADMRPGAYIVTAMVPGFVTEWQRIELRSGEKLVINFALRGGTSCYENAIGPSDHPLVDQRFLPHLFVHVRIDERFEQGSPDCGVRYRATLISSVRRPGPSYNGPSVGAADVFLDIYSHIEIGKAYVIWLTWDPYLNAFESGAPRSETFVRPVENGRVNHSVDELFRIFEGLFDR